MTASHHIANTFVELLFVSRAFMLCGVLMLILTLWCWYWYYFAHRRHANGFWFFNICNFYSRNPNSSEMRGWQMCCMTNFCYKHFGSCFSFSLFIHSFHFKHFILAFNHIYIHPLMCIEQWVFSSRNCNFPSIKKYCFDFLTEIQSDTNTLVTTMREKNNRPKRETSVMRKKEPAQAQYSLSETKIMRLRIFIHSKFEHYTNIFFVQWKCLWWPFGTVSIVKKKENWNWYGVERCHR